MVNHQWTEGIQNLWELLKKKPNNDKIYNKISDCFDNLCDKESAVNWLEASLKIKKCSRTLLKLGKLFDQHYDDTKKAEKYFLKAMKINNSDDYPHFHLGKLYTKIKKYNLAQEHFEKCLDIDNRKAVVHYHYGCLLFLKNKKWDACNHLNLAVKLKPQNSLYQSEYKKYHQLLTYMWIKNDIIEYSKKMGCKNILLSAIECEFKQYYTNDQIIETINKYSSTLWTVDNICINSYDQHNSEFNSKKERFVYIFC